jgi:hypothetical protein
MKYVGAMILLGLLGACSRQEPEMGNGAVTAGDDTRTPDTVAETSTAPVLDTAPTEVAVQRAQEDATVVAERTEEETTDDRSSRDAQTAPQQPSESPKTMK